MKYALDENEEDHGLTHSELYIMEKSWNYLIILDACRYDFFERTYKGYFNGNLKKYISVGNTTYQWAKISFTQYYDDIIYVSANPFIRTKKIPNNIQRIHASDNHISEDHFYKIINVWAEGWDNNLKTVHPNTVNKAALSMLKQHPEKRLIVHYIQPHEPYLSLVNIIKLNTLQRLSRFLRWRLINYLGDKVGNKVGNILNLPTVPCTFYFIIKLLGINALKEAYEFNLKSVMSSVKELIEYLEGTIIVTADHGELLGENGIFGHPLNCNLPGLKEIPYLEINRDEAFKTIIEEFYDVTASDFSEEDEGLIRSRLKDLGYFE